MSANPQDVETDKKVPQKEPSSAARSFTFWSLMAALALMATLLLPLWQPLLLAAVLAAGLHDINERLVNKLRGNRWFAAGVVTVGINLLILAPIAALVAIAVSQADEARDAINGFLSNGGYKDWIAMLPDPLAARAFELFAKLPEEFRKLTASGSLARSAFGGISVLGSYLTQYVLMTIALFFFFADGPRLRHWISKSLPLKRERSREIILRFRETSRVVLGANLITALAQASVATIGYFIAQVPQAFFFGLLTFFTSFFPGIGTALVALPLALLLFANGHPYAAVFLAAWSTLVVGVIDNILRPWLTRGKEQLHGAVVFFVLLGGIAVFGAMGLLLGPLALSAVLTALHLWKQQAQDDLS